MRTIQKYIEFYLFDSDEPILRKIDDIIPFKEVVAPEGSYGFRFSQKDKNDNHGKPEYLSEMHYLGFITTLEKVAKIKADNISERMPEHKIIIDRCGDYHKFSESAIVIHTITRWNKIYL